MTFDASDILRLVILLVVGGLVALLWGVNVLNKTARDRIGWSVFILVLYSAGLWGLYYKVIGHPAKSVEQEATKAGLPSEQEYKERYAKAKALFEERCKSAGESIRRTIDDVEGVFLLRVRPKHQNRSGYDSMYPGAALIGKSSDEEYIASFLRYEIEGTGNTQRSMQLSDKPTSIRGYSFVDAYDLSDGKRYRYTNIYGPNNFPPATYMPTPSLNKMLATDDPPRYAVTYEDLVDPEDRKYWVAGTVLKVLDTKTNEVIAEQTRYLFDTGLGGTDGHRNPWGWASSYVPGCSRDPRFYGETRFFVDQVLKIKQGK